MAVNVYIWKSRANPFRSGLDFDIEDLGHASAQVNNQYVSFWPAANQGDERKKLLVSARSSARSGSYEEDCSQFAMKRSADHTIEIYNLNESIMEAYWQHVKTHALPFNLRQMNCSTVVGRMLVRGLRPDYKYFLADSALSLMKRSEKFYWAPGHVLTLAQAIQEIMG